MSDIREEPSQFPSPPPGAALEAHDDIIQQDHDTTHANVHAYASNGLEILQAASAAEAAAEASIHNAETQRALQDAAAEAVNAQSSGIDEVHPDLNHHDHGLGPPPHQHHEHGAEPQPSAFLQTGVRDPAVNPKLTRLRRACDMCSMRKVKCDDSSLPCRPCRELNVDCTFNRMPKRRGPPNKHAEAAKAAKRARTESTSFVAPPQDSPQTVAKTLVNLAVPDGTLDAEEIAPLPVLELLVDDFFTYIHPLAPFPHEPTFRQSFANREDRKNPEFLGLLSSMICALVASFPRSARELLKGQGSPQSFPRAIVMIEKCRDITLATRGAKWNLKQPKTLDDAATSYFLALASGYTHQWNASRHFMAETLILIGELGFRRPKHPGELPTFGSELQSPDSLPFNHVKDQIGKRIFWSLLLGVRSFSQLEDSHTDIVIAPSTPNLPYPTYPENVDDVYVLANEVMHQQEGSVTLLTGYRFAIDIYTTMNGVVSLELAYGMSTLPWTDQRLLLRDGLLAAKSIIDNLPPELQLFNPQAEPDDGLPSLEESGMTYVPPQWPSAQPDHDLRNIIKTNPHRRRQLQYEIQKANIFVSQLATRSYFVELYFNYRDLHHAELVHQHQAEAEADGSSKDDVKPAMDGDADPDANDEEGQAIHSLMLEEHSTIISALITVLTTIPQRALEPNGGSLINKIRQVAATLLNDPSGNRKGPVAAKNEEALRSFVEVLMRMDSLGSVGRGTAAAQGQDRGADDGTNWTSQDEEEELRLWADFRDFQMRFAAATSGFNGDI